MGTALESHGCHGEDRMNVNNEMIELGQSFVQVYKIGVLWKKVLTKRYKNIVYCVHIEIENAVRCTRKEQWSRNEFCWLRCFFSVIRPQGTVRDSSYR